jgi:hypothetical protein
VAHGHRRLLLADAAGQPPEAGRPGRCRGCGRRPRRTRYRHRPASGYPWWACRSGACRRSGLLPGQRPAQEARWPAVAKDRHVHADLGDDGSAARLPTPVMVLQPVTGCGERGDHLLQVGIEAGDRGLQVPLVDQAPARPAAHDARRSGPAGLGATGEASCAACPWPARPGPGGRVRRRPGRPASPGPRRPGVSAATETLLAAGVLQGRLDPLAFGAMGREGAALG